MVTTKQNDDRTCKEARCASLAPTTPDATVVADTPHSHANGCANRPDRRSLLRGIGAAAAVTGAAALATVPKAEAQDKPPAIPRMRSAQKTLAAAPGVPDPPQVEVIALNRMAFGPRPGDLAAFLALGATDEERLQAYVDQQLEPASIDDSECDAKLAAQGFATLNLAQEQAWIAYVKREGEANQDNDRYLPVKETRHATFIRAIYSKRQLHEVLADHWHNHFNVYGWEHWTGPTFVQYDRNVIRQHMLGNFRAMLEAVAQAPAMLYYLDNQSNEGGNPNENFARELFELHGMGAENYLGVRPTSDPDIFDENGARVGYIDEDVYGATTCFTGWRVNGDTGTFEFDDSKHFPFQKIVLGQEIPSFQGIQDGRDVLDLIAEHPGTARYICRKLCRRLISDDPPESVVEAAAAVFTAQRNAPDQLKQVTRAILLSPEFRTTWAQKIKRPFEYAVSLLRASNAEFDPVDRFYWNYDSTGQALFRWSPPNGYPDNKEDWNGTMSTLQCWRFCNFAVDWKYEEEGPMQDQRRLRFKEQMPSAVKTPIQIVDYWSNRILGRVLPPAEYEPIVDFMAFGRNPSQELPADDIEERLRYMIALIFMSPSFRWR